MERRIRVLYVENAIGFGGSLTGLIDLIRDLPPEIEPRLVSNYDVRQYIDLPAGLTYHCAGIPNPPPHPGGVIRGLWRLLQHDLLPWRRALTPILREWRPDLIHANNASRINLAAGLMGWWFGVPVVSHQKGVEPDGRLERLLLTRRLYARHLADSPSMGRRLEELGLAPDRWETVYELIKPPEVEPERPVRPAEAPLELVMCSMLTPWKGQDVFLRALGRLRETRPNRFRVTLAGSSPEGDDAFPEKLRGMVRDLGLTDAVQFAGRVRDVYGLLYRSDIAVHASVLPEPFGRVVAEAMVAGLPVVASRAGGPADFVTENETGLLFEPGDDADLARQLTRLIDDPELRARLGSTASRFARREFDPPRICRELADIYRKVLTAR